MMILNVFATGGTGGGSGSGTPTRDKMVQRQVTRNANTRPATTAPTRNLLARNPNERAGQVNIRLGGSTAWVDANSQDARNYANAQARKKKAKAARQRAKKNS